jgi:hypothetical protein
VAIPLALILLLTGCATHGDSLPPGADLTTPKAAASAFYRAIARADARTAKSASWGTEEDKKWIDGMTALISGLRSYDSAIVSRFSGQATTADIDLKQALLSLADEPLTQIDGGIVSEAPDTARIEPAFHGMRLTARPPIYLRKENGLWRVDLTAMRQSPSHDPEMTKRLLEGGQALTRTARDIAAGKYKTFEAAQNALESAPIKS